MMKRWKPSDWIVLALVFLLILIISSLLTARLTADGSLLNENLDLLLAFSGTIVTAIAMYIGKNNKL